jgi:hypothetical protein
MLADKDLLELCVKVSGGFENGSGASYTSLTGNFDGQGLSVGILQWNAGQGTLQILLQKIGKSMGWDEAQSYFKSDIQHLSTLKTQDAVQFCLDHYISNGSTDVDPGAAAAWKAFLASPDSIASQVEMATDGELAHAKSLVSSFAPAYVDRNRPYAFFFDLITQSGGMRNARGSVLPIPSVTSSDYQPALDMAHEKSLKCAGIWEVSLQDDALAQLLLYYAYKRSMLSNPQYVWDALSRRGSIACLGGVVHDATVNFSSILD